MQNKKNNKPLLINSTITGFKKILHHTYYYIRHRGIYSGIVFLFNSIREWIWFASHRKSSINLMNINVIEEDLDNKKHSTFYLPTPIIPFFKLMKKLSLPAHSVFVDYGAGKGRAMLMASECGFSKIKGLEFSSSLYELAKKNIQDYIKTTGKNNFEILHIDVSTYKVQKEDNFFYFFNPFNEFILNKCLDNIHLSLEENPRKALLVYQINNKDNTDHITAKKFFHLKEVFTSFGTHFYIYEHSPKPSSP